MPPAGDETLARWREIGEWWDRAPQRSVRRFIDAREIRREEVTELKRLPLSKPGDNQGIKAYTHSQIQRDNKVSRACGNLPSEHPTQNRGPVKHKPLALLHAVSGYSFGYGAIMAGAIPYYSDLADASAALLADRFSLAGAFEFKDAVGKTGVKPLIGATFEMEEGGDLVLVAKSKIGFRSLSRLITECHLDEPRLFPLCNWDRLSRHTEGLLCLTGGDDGLLNRLLIRRDLAGVEALMDKLLGIYGRDQIFVQVERTELPWQIATNKLLLELAEKAKVTAVAGGPITHGEPSQFAAQDMLVCIESLCLIEEVEGRKPRRDPSQPQVRLPPRRGINAERHIRSWDRIREIYADRPDLIENTMRVADLCEDDVFPIPAQLPKFCENEEGLLRELAYKGAREKYMPKKFPKGRIEHELKRICNLGFAGFFLISWDMCRWAKEQGIVYSGRGSVVDSLVAHCLDMSRIDPIEHKLFFDRFLPEDATKRPDIDIDFEAFRRDDVRKYLSDTYGPDNVATVAAIGTYRTRGIIREVGKVLGVPQESLDYLNKKLHGSVAPHRLEQELHLKPELRDSSIPKERFRWVFRLANELMDLPRNIRAHSSGVVISKDPIRDTVPVMYSGVEDVRIIQWDKRSAKKCFDKIDVLCLRGNDVLSDTQRRVKESEPAFDVSTLPLDDPNTYLAMRTGELIGIPQSASPAMRQAHIRIQTKCFKDAGVVQAAIRPGVGGAVKLNEYVQRHRYGIKPPYFGPLLEKILGETYGIVVFQEQIDQLLKEFAGYKPNEAEDVREKIYKQRHESYVEGNKKEILLRIMHRGFSFKVATHVYELVACFQGYGFAQGHALAFADISIRSIWCQQNYPSQYFAAILDAQPAGYYGPATLVNEARKRGVKILGPDINLSDVKFKVEDYWVDEPPIRVPKSAVRVSLQQISGLSKETRERTVANRTESEYRSLADFVARVRPDRDELEQLILCGALDRIERNRRRLLWGIPDAFAYSQMVESSREGLPLLIQDPPLPEGIKPYSEIEEAVYERKIMGLDVEKHLVAFEREKIKARGGITAAEASTLPDLQRGFAVGNPIRLRFPPTESGRRVMFFDLEDESGLLNVTVFDETYQRDGHHVICSPYITVRGQAQDRDGHISFLAERIYPYKPSLEQHLPQDQILPLVVGDFLMK